MQCWSTLPGFPRQEQAKSLLKCLEDLPQRTILPGKVSPPSAISQCKKYPDGIIRLGSSHPHPPRPIGAPPNPPPLTRLLPSTAAMHQLLRAWSWALGRNVNSRRPAAEATPTGSIPRLLRAPLPILLAYVALPWALGRRVNSRRAAAEAIRAGSIARPSLLPLPLLLA